MFSAEWSEKALFGLDDCCDAVSVLEWSYKGLGTSRAGTRIPEKCMISTVCLNFFSAHRKTPYTSEMLTN
jgi:hypothetical protein